MLAAEATREAVQPYVKVFQMLLRSVLPGSVLPRRHSYPSVHAL